MQKQTNQLKEKKIGYYQRENKGETIYIGNLSFAKSEVEIKAIFEKFGPVKYVKVVTDMTTGKSKGIAFVQMPNKLEATKAIKTLNNTVLDERTLKVSIAQPRESDKIARSTKSKNPEIQQVDEIIEENTPKKKRKRDTGLKVLFNYLGK